MQMTHYEVYIRKDQKLVKQGIEFEKKYEFWTDATINFKDTLAVGKDEYYVVEARRVMLNNSNGVKIVELYCEERDYDSRDHG